MKMNIQWVEVALLNNPRRSLVVAQKGNDFHATLVFGDLKEQTSANGGTIQEAIENLDSKLHEEAAQEMRDLGVV